MFTALVVGGGYAVLYSGYFQVQHIELRQDGDALGQRLDQDAFLADLTRFFIAQSYVNILFARAAPNNIFLWRHDPRPFLARAA